MKYAITFRSTQPRGAVERRLRSLAESGPFRVHELEPRGGGAWTCALHPIRPEMAIGFGKVAELLVLLAREFDVEGVERISIGAFMAAS
jgi:hypothetical protein